MNFFPFNKIIIVCDGNLTEYLRQIKDHYGDNITWIIANNTVGQVAAYDLAFQNINSQYVLIC